MQKTGAVLLGVSPDTPKAQKKFQEKENLPFSLLADADKKVAEAFGVMKEKNMYGKKVWGVARTTFVIGPDGKIQHIFENVKPDGHAEEVLAYLKESGQSAGISGIRWNQIGTYLRMKCRRSACLDLVPGGPNARAHTSCSQSPGVLLFAVVIAAGGDWGRGRSRFVCYRLQGRTPAEPGDSRSGSYRYQGSGHDRLQEWAP